MSKIVAGRELCENIVEKMKEHEKNQNAPKQNNKKQSCITNKSVTNQKSHQPETASPRPGPSHVNLSQSSSDDDADDEEVCCVCGRFSPADLASCTSLVILKWAQCDGVRAGVPCKHWVHLGFCTPIRVIRRGDKFFCKHCISEE